MSKVIKCFTTDFDEYTVVREDYNDRPARMLMSSGKVPQSGIGLDDNPEQLFMYTQRLVELGIGLSPARSLVLGGGGFTVPTALVRQLGSQVDAVEIDPQLSDIAAEYFHMARGDEGLAVHNDDAARFISAAEGRYDYIVVDVFKDRAIPDSLMAGDAMIHYKRLLNEGGVVAFNCISRYHTHSETVLKGLLRELMTVFPHISVYPADVHIDKRSDQNLIVVASRHDASEQSQYVQSYPVDVIGV